MHEGHKLYEINDQDSLKKENITIDSSSNDFNNIIESLNKLKDKIEKEIINIDKEYDKVFNEVEKSYDKKREKLNNEEKNLKENLQNEITKVKEKLEEYLSLSSKLIRENERILKGIKSLKKEEENIIKILSYVSKINKNKKSLQSFFQEFMKNIKINYQEDQNNIIYKEYYFNRLIIPKNIKFENNSFDNFTVTWEIDKDINMEEIKNNEIKFIIEIRKESKNEEFKKIYEGNNNSYIVKELEENTNYEIRICIIHNGIESPWSEIKKVKTLINYCDSKILEESNRKNEFCKKLQEWTKSYKLELLYRGSRDGPTSENFHNKCDNKGATICLYKNEKGYIFGGYNPIPWQNKGNWIKNDDSFIFTLTNVHNTEPTKFPHKNGKDSILFNQDYGPTFDDFYIFSNYENAKADIKFPRGHIDTLNLGKSIFSGDKKNEINKTQIKEIEVFKILK